MSQDSELELYSNILLRFSFDGISAELQEPQTIAAEIAEGIALLRQLAERGHQQAARGLTEQTLTQINEAAKNPSGPVEVFAEATNDLLDLYTELGR